MHDISFRPRRFVWNALVAESTSKQIAWGIALGVLIGFVPKGNLVAIGLAAILFSLRVNLLSALVTIVACSAVGMLLDPFFDHIGRTILTIVPLQGLFSRIYQWPFMPWTAFNNTVVMGALFVGILQLYPTYRIARRMARRSGDASNVLEEQRKVHGFVAADAM
jgi:uncharacterized protein (TIGR03546 family)